MIHYRFLLLVLLLIVSTSFGQGKDPQSRPGPLAGLSTVLGRPTEHSIAVSVLSATDAEVFIEYGVDDKLLSSKSAVKSVYAGKPVEFELTSLRASSTYTYRTRTRTGSATEFSIGEPCVFHTQRAPGETFTFALQGDSHPERLGKMYDPDLYVQTMNNVAKDAPDFYFTMGDDFSIERLISRKLLNQESVDAVYAHQRGFLGLIGRTSPLFLVNGNHEQAARYLLDGTANNAAVYAGTARIKFFPLPAPDEFYTGNSDKVEHIGLLRDYYAWTWGDALFVVIDPYWHSSVAVDNEAGVEGKNDGKGAGKGGGKSDGKRGRDLWNITLGDAQYAWLSKTLRESKSPFKFVFSHHVLGTGRGAVEVATKYEWGGEDQRGVDRFSTMRPTWKQPIHNLMRDSGVTIFFQGHDHIYAKQELEGVIYQAVPNPADSTFTAFNREAYKTGDIRPNSGHLRVTVSHESAKVEYVSSFRKQDEGEGRTNGALAHSYTVAPRVSGPEGKP